MNILFALIVASAAVICAGDEIPNVAVPVGSQEAPAMEKTSNVDPTESAKVESSPEKVDEMLKSVKDGIIPNEILNTVKEETPKLVVAVNGNNFKNLADKEISEKEAKVDPEASLKKSKKEKQTNQGSNKNELSEVINDFINKIFKAPVELFNSIKDAIKDLNDRIQNSSSQPDPIAPHTL